MQNFRDFFVTTVFFSTQNFKSENFIEGEGREGKFLNSRYSNSMKAHCWNKRQKIDRLLTQLASYKSVLAREFKYQVHNHKHINYLQKFLVVIFILQSICTRKFRASCMNTRSILWCLFQKRSLMLSPILHFKNFSLLHSSSLSTEFSNSTTILWKTYVCIGQFSEISFFQLRGLIRRLLKMAAPISSILSEEDPCSRLVTRQTCGQRSTSV